ncbi:universal stress protein [Vulgatibacter sp.]|uniref:universal stress protein n=1 Tax=Vulgatibacter sp. TaxID=1971226 RepID=UPI00356936C3
MFRRILVGVDGSEVSLAAAAAAGRLATEGGGDVTICHVVAPAPVFVDAAALTLVEYDRRAAEESGRILQQARARLPAELHVEEKVLHGQPASSLVEEARLRGYDLLVVGSHGRSGIRRFLLGSVASQVVAHAPIPVLVHRDSQGVSEPS